MPRSALFMSVLFCLLIFQSLWNVAAAFCAHENQEKALHHFGHHAALNYEISQHGHTEKTDVAGTTHKAPLNLSDHHDHLPSCFHVVIVEAQEKIVSPLMRSSELKQQYYWSNSYKSPHISKQDPPPVLTLL
ncbi:cation efflux protein, CzcI-like [Acinetobacter sp. WA-87]|uniref:cation efflux protein, CzcI-like n=1 Tax=Acinetobacter sp. WA-87 TaxID=3153556 RepID=UPI003266C354